MAIKFMILAVTPAALIIICSEAFKAMEYYKLSMTFEGLLVPLFGIIVMPILALKFGIIGAVISLATISWLVFIAAFIVLRKVIVRENKRLENAESIENTHVAILEFLKIGVSLLIMEIAAYWIGNGDALIIGHFIKDTEEVGIYVISQRLANLVSFILIAINTIVAPKFSKLYSSNKMKELEKIAKNSTRLLLGIATPILLLYLSFPELLLGLFGEEFKRGGIILSIIAIGQFINVATGSVGYLLIMCGYEKIMRNIVVISALVTVLIQILLISMFSVVGVAIGTAIGLAIQNISAIIVVRRKLKIRII
jgi:O-antigen/teichoic acid export membrane protein